MLYDSNSQRSIRPEIVKFVDKLTVQKSLMKRSKAQILGEYQLSTFLGNGGSSQVYRAWQAKLSREVAIKLLLPNLSSEAQHINRFHNEAKMVAGLEHLHIVKVFDYGIEDDIAFLVMPLLLGGTLVDRVLRHPVKSAPLVDLREIAKFLVEISDALNYAHNQKIVHCDIKPANILFDENGAAYLADFGIAAMLGEQRHPGQPTDFVSGSIAYMAPEVWRGEPPSKWVDQYALGLVMYALVTGQAPFVVQWANYTEVMQKHLTEMPMPLHYLRKEASPELSAVVERAIAKAPKDRYETVTDFASDFRSAVERSSGPLPAPSWPDPRSANWFSAPTVVSTRMPLPPVPPPPQPPKNPVVAQVDRPEKIFLSYRQTENASMIDFIYKSLANSFTASLIFRDQESTPFGINFKTYLNDMIKKCKVVLVIIGPQWLLHKDSSGRRFIDNPNDFIRVAVQSALENKIPIIPVFIDGAVMPEVDELPEELRLLPFMRSLDVRSGIDTANDLNRLSSEVRKLVS
jgi:serine/threonine protein kinase